MMKVVRLRMLLAVLVVTAAMHSGAFAQTTPTDTTLAHQLFQAKRRGWLIRLTTDTGVTPGGRINLLDAGRVKLIGGTAVEMPRILRIERRITSGGGGKSLALASMLLIGGSFAITYANVCDCTNYKTAGLVVGAASGVIAGGIVFIAGYIIHPPEKRWLRVWPAQ